jgi:predicted nucleic acid-binding protein
LIDFVAFATIFPIDDRTTDKTIELRRKYKIKLPDAIIAATAIANNFTLITHNIKDFQKIEELQIINSYDMPNF